MKAVMMKKDYSSFCITACRSAMVQVAPSGSKHPCSTIHSINTCIDVYIKRTHGKLPHSLLRQCDITAITKMLVCITFYFHQHLWMKPFLGHQRNMKRPSHKAEQQNIHTNWCWCTSTGLRQRRKQIKNK